MARPTKKDNLIVKKLEEAFALGCTVMEACYYANISKQTYYNWIREDSELLDRFECLQTAPVLEARKALIESFKSRPDLALKFLMQKRAEEFGSRINPISF